MPLEALPIASELVAYANEQIEKMDALGEDVSTEDFLWFNIVELTFEEIAKAVEGASNLEQAKALIKPTLRDLYNWHN
jgi:hypothetical protein